MTSRIRIFVASPGDVPEERASLNTVVNELNRTCAALVPDWSTTLELIRWETHAYPEFGRPQGVINAQLGDYDIFVGILWKRFGTPSGRADSGTEEEFRLAYDRWRKDGTPHILMYFNVAPSPPPKSADEVRQLAKVVEFRAEIDTQGLVWEYAGAMRFADTIRPHLTEVIGRLLRASKPAGATPVEVETRREVMAGTSRVTEAAPGDLIRITELAPDDAYYDQRDQFVGTAARVIEIKREGDWFGGRVALEVQPSWSVNPERYFYAFRFEKISA